MSKAEKQAAKAEKKAAKAEAKATKKANDNGATKETVIKSITAIICVIAICVATYSAINKCSDAVVQVAEKKATATGSSNVGAAADGNNDVGGGDNAQGNIIDNPSDTPVDGTAAADGDVSATDDTNAAGGNTGSAAGSTTKTNGSAATPSAKDPTQYSKAEVVAYYNSCLNNSYAQKVTIKKTEQIKIFVEEVTGGTVVKNIANQIVERYATETVKEKSFANGKPTEGQTAADFALPAKLKAEGAKTATVKKSGSGYEINIVVVKESATLTKFPVYNKQCSYPLDLASVDLSPAKVVQADFEYPGTVLKATVDSKGRVTKATVYMPLQGTGAGEAGIIKLTAKVSGSWNHTSTYTY